MKYIVRDFEKRYFAGIEMPGGIRSDAEVKKIGDLWNTFFNEVESSIQSKVGNGNYIGLECYPPFFEEEGVFDYYALVETHEKEEVTGNVITKKLPKGKYISFQIEFDDISVQIKEVYKYIQDNNIKIHPTFDYEEYIEGENYMEKGAKLYISFLLEE